MAPGAEMRGEKKHRDTVGSALKLPRTGREQENKAMKGAEKNGAIVIRCGTGAEWNIPIPDRN